MGRSKSSGSRNGSAKRNGVGNGNGSGSSAAAQQAKSKHNGNGALTPPASKKRSRFSITLGPGFLLLSFTLSTIVTFSIGWVARLILLSHYGLTPYTYTADSSTATSLAIPKSGGAGKHMYSPLNEIEVVSQTMSGKKVTTKHLPAPKILEGKDVPFTTYASKTFQMEGAATSHTLHIDRSTALIMTKSRKEFDGGPDFQKNLDEDVKITEEVNVDEKKDGWVPACEEKACSRGKEPSTPMDDHNDDSDGLHLPAGQHLLVDIKDVDSNFLNSEERLAKAMISLTEETGLTLLSYHCHALVPIGVSCAGVLLESHVAFHTWPLEGVITMDLFTCGGGLLIPTLPIVEDLFAIPSVPGPGESEGDVVQPTMLWSHKLRGFREGFAKGYVRSANPLDGSLGRYVLGKLDFDIKTPLLSAKTAIQSVNVYEVMEPKARDVNSYVKSVSAEEDGEGGRSYEAMHPEYFAPDKVLFLDGILQSTLHGDAAYHESIVHPAMMTNSNPKRVAIVGGGEGATLREVLKYKSVEEVVIFEIDQELVEICKEYLAEWSDCSDIEGSDATSCFDDSRARLVYVDAFKWFMDTFGKKTGQQDEEKFDVIILDALDPNTSIEIAGGLYNDTSFVDSLSNGLTEDGVFVVQLGKSKMISDPADEVGRFRDTSLMIDALKQSGFKGILTYDEGHSKFYMPWSYLVALKQYESRAAWHRTAPEIEIKLQQRLHKTKSGREILRYFDAPTMLSYQLPSKASETAYCRREEYPDECDEFVGIQPDEYINLPSSEYLKVDKSKIAHGGRGVFAAKNLPANSTLALDEASKAISAGPLAWSVITEMEAWGDEHLPYVEDEISGLYTFVEGYGHGAVLLGKLHMSVDSGIMLFINHGCNGTSNYGYIFDEDHGLFTEFDVDLDYLDEIWDNVLNTASVYSPANDRNWRHHLNSGDYMLREIKEGEEVVTDYLAFAGSLDGFKGDVLSLRKQCAGEEVGSISTYESESSESTTPSTDTVDKQPKKKKKGLKLPSFKKSTKKSES